MKFAPSLFAAVAAGLLTLTASAAYAPAQETPSRSTMPFDADWRFLQSDAPNAQSPAFDDAAWRTLNVPHDWAIEGPFAETNPAGQGGAYLPTGIGWYRKHFTLPTADTNRRVFIEFDGVMANSDVWINGDHLGKRPSGYISFRYELTGHLHFGNVTPNILAVRCDDSAQPASRWYAGAGIYRHVRLVVTSDVHVEASSTFVSTPSVTDASATVRVQSTVDNQTSQPRTAALVITLLGPNGTAVKTITTPQQSIVAGQSTSFDQQIEVPHPERWDITHPVLYTARVTVLNNNKKDDEEQTPFGIREFHFDPATGFWLNGRNFKIYGAALHGDAGSLGVAVPLAAWKHRLLALRALGVNAIRTAHNPPSPDFLDLCDRLGFLVMDEMFDCWTVGKNPYDYHLYFNEWSRIDTRDTVRRDRNHPSIILWSAGNEIHDTPKTELAHNILAGLVQVFHDNDPTRPVTQALFRPNVSHDYDNGLADLLDVVGQNYREQEILAAYRQKPTRKIIGTENTHDRGQWLAMRDNPPYSGQFIWAGADYLGESGRWPAISRDFGLLDRTDVPHPQGLERQSWWSSTPVVHMVRRVAPPVLAPADPGYEPIPQQRPRTTLFADWTPAITTTHEETVEVYSNADQVELSLNGKSLGSQPIHPDASPRIWKVPFEAGTLKAVASNQARTVATEELHTAGKPDHILLASSRKQLTKSWDDLAYVTATVVDANGVAVPAASNVITFAISGSATVIAVDNADVTSHEPFQAKQRHAFQGRSIAILRGNSANGPTRLTASSPGLSPATIAIQTAQRPQ
jgi:beta-galactosidase